MMTEAFKKGYTEEMEKMAAGVNKAPSILAKIKAPRTGDTGPPGKGLNDPRAKMQQRLMAKRGK